MTTEFLQRQIDRLLAQAAEGLERLDWELVRARAQAILALDPENADARGLFDAAARASSNVGQAPPPALTQARVPVLQAPESFVGGRYQVKRFLGEGGKKRVYLAHDMRLDRDVAFALIKTEGLDAEGRERIEREAQAMGKLGTHPHIVSVYDMGLEPSSDVGQAPSPAQGGVQGAPYLVTELMAGGDVEGLLQNAEEHRLPIERAIEIAQQVCRGLGFAHEHGLVHRDLKPGNVWLTDSGMRNEERGMSGGGSLIPHTSSLIPGVAKIGDFGLAVALDRSRLTQAGMMVGTVAYMPPEQALGGEVTPRSDLYSLGAMLYEMVCGRPPFVGEETVAVVTQHLNTPPVAPSWHRPECPVGLEALILRLLEKDPAKRPESAAAVRQALETAGGTLRPGSGQAALPRGDLVPTEAGTAAAAGDPLYRRTFVGREQELRQLESAFDAALSGRGSLAMVVGEPGIGKTSVCEQLVTYATVRGGKALVGHCYEEGSLSIPYLPFVEAMRSYVLTRDSDGLKEDLGSGAGDVARIVSEVRDRVQVSPVEGSDPDEQRWRLLQSVAGFLRNASAVQPLVIVLEDLHDADRGTIDLLLHLARNLTGARLLMVGTYRDVEVNRTHPLSSALAELRRSASFLRVPLRGLTVDEVQRMMSSIRGQDVPWGRAEVVHRQTEGNPLFVQEVLRYLVEEGIVVRQGDRYVLTDTGNPDASIPEGLRDVIGKRLSRLSQKANQVLSIASVIGREFRFDLLQTVAGLPESELEAALEEASERALIETRSAIGTLGFRFTHAFFRQTLYEELFASRRLRLHQQVAGALEQLYGSRVEDHAAELAEHFAQSTDSADLQKALHYSVLAARRASAVYAHGEAARHLEQALKVQEVLAPDDRARRCDLLLALGEAMLPSGEGLQVSETVAKEALSLAEAIGDRQRAAKASYLGTVALIMFGSFALAGSPTFIAWAQKADAYAAPGSLERVSADRALAQSSRAQGQRRKGRELAARALALARQLDDPEALFTAASDYIVHSPTAQQEAEQFAVAREFLEHSHEGVSARTLGIFMVYADQYFLRSGLREEAERIWGDVRQLADRTSDAGLTSWALSFPLDVAFMDGRLEDAASAVVPLLDRAAQLGSPGISRTRALQGGARALLHLGRGEEALALLHDVTNPAHPLQTSRALCLAHLGRDEESRACIQGVRPTFEEDPAVHYVAQLVEAALVIGDQETAVKLEPALEGAMPINSGGGIGFVALGRLRGAVASLSGDFGKARAEYDAALEVCERMRLRPEIACIRLELAELLLGSYTGERSAAQEHLDFAIGEFREMKMQPALERALKHKGLLNS